MMDFKDFNQAECSDTLHLIPGGAYIKARVDLEKSTNPEDSYVFKSPRSGVLYLKSAFHVVEGPYASKKIIQVIGLKSNQEEAQDFWGREGRAFIRALLESARHVHPKDLSDAAQRKRRIEDFSDLRGLEVAAQVGIKRDSKGFYPPQNKIQRILTRLHPLYGKLLGLVTAEGAIELSQAYGPKPQAHRPAWVHPHEASQ